MLTAELGAVTVPLSTNRQLVSQPREKPHMGNLISAPLPDGPHRLDPHVPSH